MLAGAGLVIYGQHRAGDHSGTLSQYNDWLSSAALAEWTGAGCLAAAAGTTF